MSRPCRLAFLSLVSFTLSCGGSSSPTTPPTTSPSPPAGEHSLTAIVYYDFVGNGTLDPEETVRFAGVEVQVGQGSGTTEANGEALVQGVSAGSHRVLVDSSTLPPFFALSSEIDVEVPRDTEAVVPVALPIGQNQPFRYLCSGDSISQGLGSSDGEGYRSILNTMLSGFYGVPIDMKYRGANAGTSAGGAARTERDLSLVQPAYTLIAWGTNDYYTCGPPATCDTVENLRSMVLMVKAASSLPCVATIIPANVGFNDLAPASRNEWVAEMNELIRTMAHQEGALVVDLYAAFMASGELSALFVDHVHPNPQGYDLIARTWFDALTEPRGLAATSLGFQTATPPLLSAPSRIPAPTLMRDRLAAARIRY